MDRVFESGAAGSPPSPPSSPSFGYASKGNPGTGTAPTKLGPWWYHMVTEELRGVVAAAGLTPDHTNVGQLAQAIQQLIASGGIKMPVRAATTANIASLAGGAPSTLDGVTLIAGDRILVKDQTTGSQNGIYVVTTLGTGANGTWNRATDADGVGELFSGLLVVVQEGTAGADTIWELSTDGTITLGATSLAFVRKDSTGAGIQGAFKNLVLFASGTAASVNVSYDELVLGDGAGNYLTERNASGTITTTNTGAGGLDTGALAGSTWYSVWRIAKPDGTKTWLFSLSATAPTMPVGYTLKARVGWFRTDASGNKYPLSFQQNGRRVQYKVAAGSNVAAMPIAASGVQGSLSTPTWVAVSLANFVPSTAGMVYLVGHGTTSSDQMAMAPNNSYGASGSTTNPPPIAVTENTGAGYTANPSGLVLESSSIYVAHSSATCKTYVTGWEDNL